MDKEDKKILIEYLISHKNSLWTAIIVLIGGLAGILLTFNYSVEFLCTLKGFIEIILFILGSFLLGLMLTGLINTTVDIKKYLNKGG
ncbi:MAG: hypothetical protein PHC64_00685 [Candidatus Gastranaerophilales bacterium]|nr:hypothetical protein [Candidatus Gastranaerophilales bacterium]